jgi:FMN phosphatase YigB (HAD superfamily)
VFDSSVPERFFQVVDSFIKGRWHKGLASSSEEIVSHVAGEFDGRCSATQARLLLDAVDEIYLSVLRPTIVDGADEFLRWASSRVPVYLISDTYTIRGRLLDRVLEGDGLRQYLKACFYSDELGVEKPNPEAVNRVLTIENIPSAELLHIGDLAERDAEMSRRANTQCILVDRARTNMTLSGTEHLRGVVTCCSFHEIQRLIDGRLHA